MTLEQEKHLQQIKDEFVVLADAKYRKGQEEHGGDLFDKDVLWLLDQILYEAIDQVVYALTLREKLVLGGVK